MILYYLPIAQNTGNKTVRDFVSEVYMLVYVCAHILILFLFTGLIPVYTAVINVFKLIKI